jgi:hypothetical protein
MHLRVHERFADAVERLEGMVRRSPGDQFAAEQYAVTIEDIFTRQSADEPPGPCRLAGPSRTA